MSVLFCLKQNDRKILPLKWLRIDQTTSLSFEHVYRKSRADSQIEVKAKVIDFPFCFHKKKASVLKPFSSAFIGALKRMIGKKRVRKY